MYLVKFILLTFLFSAPYLGSPNPIKVLIIGDSISIGYLPFVTSIKIHRELGLGVDNVDYTEARNQELSRHVISFLDLIIQKQQNQ